MSDLITAVLNEDAPLSIDDQQMILKRLKSVIAGYEAETEATVAALLNTPRLGVDGAPNQPPLYVDSIIGVPFAPNAVSAADIAAVRQV